ncbi:MAG: outer membrane protein transport protein [Desulfuromonadaceae bacterium]|nr:outer membrane protein transport protein [Desulfuromonadaceae bacterium]MDD5104469.1 outer membrane protein transport protein [Desulfuromonadaceae bacterium]
MRNKLILACVLATMTGVTTLAGAAGLKVNEQGAKAMAMGNAFTAQADDPSALFYNPAGIAFLKGTQVNLGSTTIYVPSTEFTGTAPLSGTAPTGVGTTSVRENSKNDIFIAPAFYATHSFEGMPISVGLSVNAIYPLAKSWDNSSAFRSQITNIAVKPINVQPTVAYRFDEMNLAVAAGLDVTHAIVTLQKTSYSIDPDTPNSAYERGPLGLDGTATDVGWNVGLKWKPIPSISFGVAYRSEIKLKIKGDANILVTTPTGFSTIGMTTSATSTYSQMRAVSGVSSTITLPDSLALGVAWQPTDALTLEFDAERTGWSSMKSLGFHFDSPQFANLNNAPPDNPKALNWKDVWCYKVGSQYALTKNIDLRAGYMFDQNPVPDSTLGPLLPDADRHSFSIGQGFHNEHFSLDLAYMWTHFVDRTVNNQDMTTLLGENGTFKSDVHLFGGSITVKF